MYCRNNFKITRQVLLFTVAFLLFIFYYPLHESRNIKRTTFKVKPKLILFWTPISSYPFNKLEIGNKSFIKNKCVHNKCYVTDDKQLLNSTDFDAIIFNGRDVFQMKSEHLPKARNSKQKYIFASLDSSFKYPECNDQFNNYFNWTWSYKLDSEILWRVFTIHNRTNNAIVAPNLDVTWYISDDPVTNEDRWRLKDILKRKTRTIAWFVSECEERSKMEENRVKSMLGQELLENYNITIDIFGGCGQEIFPYDVREEILKRDYHFYMAFEDSLTSDYVGEELLLALDGYTVPIVYGTVDYTRFLPPDSYLNFADQTVGELAAIINSSMYNTTEYETYFKWRDIYEQKRSTDSDICNLCEVLHDQEMYQNTTSYISFSDWWNPSDVVTCAT